MEQDNKVVARFLDGRVLKGVTHDFFPNRAAFHIASGGKGGEVAEVRCLDLKALFFVRSLEGDPARQDLRGFVNAPPETAHGRKLAVLFRDNEVVCGYTLSWSPDREGFFLSPADAGGNNLRIYVVASGTAEVQVGLRAEALARRMLSRFGEAGPVSETSQPGKPAPSTESARPSGLSARPTGQFTRPPVPGTRAGGGQEPGAPDRRAAAKPPDAEAA